MSRCHVLYWIWLSLCISPGSRASDLLLEYFDEDAQKIYEAGKADYDRLDLSEDVKARLLLKSSEEAKHIYYYCKERGIRLLAYDDPAFPGRLRRIGRRPVLLYCKGRNIDLNDNLMVAMVGTRNMSSYGKRSAYTIAYDLCSAGAVVVSGMALGIDAICHRGVLDASGDTVAVLGCGVDVTYPKQNFELMLELERKGSGLKRIQARNPTEPVHLPHPQSNHQRSFPGNAGGGRLQIQRSADYCPVRTQSGQRFVCPARHGGRAEQRGHQCPLAGRSHARDLCRRSAFRLQHSLSG